MGSATVRRLVASGIRAVILDPDTERAGELVAELSGMVQTASISAFDGQVGMVPYAAAKGAIAAMTLPMARDLAPIGVRVCAIAPGAVLTPRVSSPVVQEMLVEDVVFPKRLGHPEEYAHLAESILRNPYLNGEVIRLDGAARLSSEMRKPSPRRSEG